MRKPLHISPTSFFLWKKDKEEYFKKYLSERRFVRDAQTIHMANGSAFDVFIKNYLLEKLKTESRSYQKESLDFETQVEEQHRDAARIAGMAILKFYTESGALANLLAEIGSSAGFEFKVTGHIRHSIKVIPKESALFGLGPEFSIILNGRPDAFFLSTTGTPIVLDWKVNGWMSSKTTSPKAGYIDLFPERKVHKDALRTNGYGISYNLNGSNDAEWSTQLAIYGWLLGSPVGEPIIGGIEQIVGPSTAPRVAKFRFLISKEFQEKLYMELCEMWTIIQSDWIFRELAIDESIARCKALQEQVTAEDNPVDINDIDSLFK